jgi:hypothetical protein
LGADVSDRYGIFYVKGYTDELSDIDPLLSIYSNCDDAPIPCLKRIDIRIPQSYIESGKVPFTAFDIGTYNLDGYFEGQERDCIE